MSVKAGQAHLHGGRIPGVPGQVPVNAGAAAGVKFITAEDFDLLPPANPAPTPSRSLLKNASARNRYVRAVRERQAEQRLRGDRDNRADGAASVLRWLIGADDRVPVRGQNRGELVGGYDDVVWAMEQIAQLRDEARQRRQARPQVTDYLDGVIVTLEWVLGERSRALASGQRCWPVTAHELKQERVHAEDLADEKGVGVKLTITWLLGEITASPS